LTLVLSEAFFQAANEVEVARSRAPNLERGHTAAFGVEN